MPKRVPGGVVVLLILAQWMPAPARSQTAPAGKAAQAPATKPAAKAAQAPAAKAATPGQPSPNQVVATVNDAKVTRGEVVALLSQYPLPPGSEEQSYQGAVNAIINLKLLESFLERQKVAVDDKDIAEQVKKLDDQLKAEGRDLRTALAQNGLAIEELQRQIAQTLRWKNYVLSKATDPVLKKNFESNRDFYNQTQVKASHILVKVDEKASAAEKEQAKQKLDAIKKEIEGNKISFADAANKYSEDDGNVRTKAGGDLGFFFRKGQFIEKFAAAAFAQKLGTISEPVETEYGFHLIKVTDRKEGTPANFEEVKPLVTNEYASELQQSIVEEERKAAKIDIKPMPDDLFAKAPAPAEAPAPGGTAPAPKGAPAAPKGANPASPR